MTGQREKEPARRGKQASNRPIFWRIAILMTLFGVLSFLALGLRLWNVAVVHHEEYQSRQLNQFTKRVEVRANRGVIRDAAGDPLAISATVHDLILSPGDLVKNFDDKKSKYKKADGTVDEDALNAAIQAQRDLITDEVCTVLGMDRETVLKHMSRSNSMYEVLKKGIEGEQRDELARFIKDNHLGNALRLEPASKRYYPFSSVASHVLGFVNDEGGAYGVEAAYDDLLRGSDGRVITSRTAAGTEIYNSYSNYLDAEDGCDVTLTIDSSVQRMAEQTLAAGIKKYEVQNGGICIVMQPRTGAILAMASSPDYDPNRYGTIKDETLNAQAAQQAETEYRKLKEENPKKDDGSSYTDEELRKMGASRAITAALNKQWRSKVLNDTYEPGSTFKSVVLAAALETGVVKDSDTFYCPGYYVVNGRRISCSDHGGHGTQTLAKAVQNSCNPAFMMIGQRLGAEKFYDYFEAFGLKDTTGIDLPGEAKGQVWSRDYLTSAEGYLSLATASFGQRFTVSPLQLLSAFSATVNGGHLMRPYVVSSVSRPDGTVVRRNEPTEIRQVVSEQTSRHAAEILESVVAEGTGRNAYVAGYRIGGKTGTAETEVKDEEIVSFVGFAPANDPQVIVLLYFDSPKHASPGSKFGSTGYYISGGQMVAPLTGQLIADVMDYLGVERQYTGEEAATADVTVPKTVGYDLATAKIALRKKNLNARTVGQGDTVTAQIPAAGASIPGNSTVILYMGQEAPTEEVKVPDLRGLGLEQAKRRLNDHGLYLRATGATGASAAVKAVDQSVAAGETVEPGTVITVRFADTSVNDTFIPLE